MGQTPEKNRDLIKRLAGKANLRTIVVTLSAIVVFVTTYLLILPAITLDKDEAIQQGGIDVAIEQSVDEADVEAVEEPVEEPAVQTEKATDENVKREPEKEKADEPKEKAAPEKTEVKLLTRSKELTAETDESAGFTVSAFVDKNNKVPADVSIQATELTKDTEGFDYDKYYEEALEALMKDDGSINNINMIRFYDISLESETQDDSVEPENTVSVKIAYDKGIKVSDAENIRIVHFAAQNNGEEKAVVLNKKENKVETTVDGKSQLTEASFETDGFSVYAVVGAGTEEEESRATVNFYGKDTTDPIATVYVKNSDTLTELEEIVSDPGCGTLDSSKKELFDGWIISTVNTTDGTSYNVDTEGKTIEEVREYVETLDIKEGDVVNVYAKIVRTITVTYEGETDNVILGSVSVKVLGSDDPNNPSTAEHIVSMNYTPPTSTQAFMGWNVAEGSSNIVAAVDEGESITAPYPNGTLLTLKGDIKLSVNAPQGHWLVFDENGKGATYNAPKFVKDGQVTVEPAAEMVRLGYSFGGWYTDQGCTDGNEFEFGNELTDNITIYAKWTAATSANYTVIVWKERMTDTYAENGGTGEGKKKNYDFAESFTLKGAVDSTINAVSNGTSSVVDGDAAGTRYYNARIQGITPENTNVNRTVSYTGYHCAGYDTDVTVTPEGNAVLNVYYDRNTVTYTFYTHGQDTQGAWYLCREDGGQIIKDGQNATNNTRIATRSGNDYNQYTGRVSYGDGRTYYYSTTGACGGTNMREAHWEYVTSTSSSWNVYQQYTGLYGEALNWPTDTSIWWYEGHNDTTGTGTRMTYKSAFLPLDDDMTVEYWGNTASAAGTIHFWTQNVDGGNNYTDRHQVASGNANFNINDKFTGFYAYQYRTDNGAWQNVGAYNESTGIYGSAVSFQNRLDIRYNRITANITFLDGSYFDGNGNPIDETPQAEAFHTSQDYFYEADVSSYNKNGSDYYTPPTKEGYTFAGWYADDACTIEYDFNTMPATGITVYAKWIQNQYRVFLHPNVPATDNTLDWGSNTQGMNFRTSSGSKVSAPTGTRTGYSFIGWYLDEACTEVFDADRFILNDTTVTTPYDKTVDMTDPMDKWGNGATTNSDITGYNGGDRFWITRKLDLYAKWRAELIGAEGIGVKYDANGGSNAPSDTNLYLDNTDTIAQGATTPPDNQQQFLYWVVQKWDESAGEYVDLQGDKYKVYPGGSFTVLKDNALAEELEGSTTDDPKYRYTVQLRAEYGPKDVPTPTHLTWYANGGVASDGVTEQYTDSNLQINEAVDIKQANTFHRDGYEFIGWARIDATGDDYTISEKDLLEDDLFLKYENGKFYAQVTEGSDAWTEVSQVAADERDPYHDLYAVWAEKEYTVTVKKIVNGIDGDDEIPFAFTPSFTGISGADYSTQFQIVAKEGGVDIEDTHYHDSKEFKDVPYNTEFTIVEEANSEFNTTVYYTVTNADNETDNITARISDNTPIIAKGDVEVTFINTRRVQEVRIMKTEIDNKTPLGGAVFTVNVGETDYTLMSDSEDGYLKNEIFTDGILLVPHGTYTLTEITAPNGYNLLADEVVIRVDEHGISVLGGYEVKEPTEDDACYTIIIPNNPGVVLPNTGGPGVHTMYLIGTCLTLLSLLMFIKRRQGHSRGK